MKHRNLDDVFYEIRGSGREELRNRTVDDAVVELLDMQTPDCWSAELEVIGYRRMKVNEGLWKALELSLVEMIYEQLDDEYGDPDGPTGADESVRAAVHATVLAAMNTYTPWPCEPDDSMSVTISVPEWVRKNCAGWLDEPAVAEAIRKLEEENDDR